MCEVKSAYEEVSNFFTPKTKESYASLLFTLSLLTASLYEVNMGFKQTSGIISVSNRVEQPGIDDFGQLELDLPLDTLNNEIFVVLAIDFALSPSDVDETGNNSATLCQLSTTSQTAITGIENSNVLARGENAVSCSITGAGILGVAPFTHMSNDTPTGDLDYMGIIATPNCYLAVDSSNQATVKSVAMRMWGYRAKADAATYAALVQSEVLSA